jgi:hypothetical protein
MPGSPVDRIRDQDPFPEPPRMRDQRVCVKDVPQPGEVWAQVQAGPAYELDQNHVRPVQAERVALNQHLAGEVLS